MHLMTSEEELGTQVVAAMDLTSTVIGSREHAQQGTAEVVHGNNGSAKRGRGHGAMDERQRRIRVTRGRIRRDLIRS